MTFNSRRVCFVIAPQDFASPLALSPASPPLFWRLVPQPAALCHLFAAGTLAPNRFTQSLFNPLKKKKKTPWEKVCMTRKEAQEASAPLIQISGVAVLM